MAQDPGEANASLGQPQSGQEEGHRITACPKTTTDRGVPAGARSACSILAECQYQQGKFVRADATYQKLLNVYPASRHMNTAVQRQYAIAKAWLAADDPKAKTDHETTWKDHFNGRLPLIDVNGSALRTLDHIRHQDPRGPLADVVTMMMADHYMSIGRLRERGDSLRSDHVRLPQERVPLAVAARQHRRAHQGLPRTGL